MIAVSSGISVCRQTGMCVCMCVCAFGIYPHTEGLQPVFNHLVCSRGWMVLGSVHLCEDAKGMQGGDESRRRPVCGRVSCRAPRPHQDLREAVETWGLRAQRAGKAQVYCNPASLVLGNFRRPRVSLCPPSAKGFSIAAPHPPTINHASTSGLLSPFEQ